MYLHTLDIVKCLKISQFGLKDFGTKLADVL